MKNRIIAIILLLTTLSYGQNALAKKDCLPAEQIMLDRENFVFYIEKDKPFSGCIDTTEHNDLDQNNYLVQSDIENGKLKTRSTYDQNDVLRAKTSYSDDEKTEYWQVYYPNGVLQLEETIINGKSNGITKLYWENGNLKGENTYKDDKLNGKFTKYYEDGKLHVVGNYKDNKLDGEHIIYYPDGSIKSKGTYKDDKKVYQTKQLKINGEMRNAVVVNSVKEEYEYLRQEYPDYKFVMQAAIINDEVESDVLTIESSDKKRKDIYFDISPFFGNYKKLFENALKQENASDKN